MSLMPVYEVEGFTFDNYITVPSNTEAFEAAKTIVNQPSCINPVCIYSPYRTGKTHLLKAIYNAFNSYYPSQKACYIKFSRYITLLMGFKEEEYLDDICKDYASNDILLLDDIDFVAGDEWLENVLLRLVKAIIDARHQVVLSSKLPFGTFPELDKYLNSIPSKRIIRIASLNVSERRDLFVKADKTGLPANLLAEVENFALDNPVEVEVFAERIRAYQTILHKQISLKLLKKALRDCKHRETRYDPEEIIALSAKLFSVSVDEVTGPTKYKNAVLARMISMYLLRESCGLDYSATKDFYSKNNPVSPFTSDLDSMADKITYRAEETKTSRRRYSFLPFDDEEEDEEEDEDEV